MKKLMLNLVIVIGVSILGIGAAFAAASSLDCGDDDAQPIIVHSSAAAKTNDS